jgi:GNAT superfamily N-acetyltransferase
MPQDYLDGLDPGRARRPLAGQGLGRQLMTATLANLAAAGYREAALWVLQDNARARPFYSQAGWAADGTAGRCVRRGMRPG